MNADAWKHQKYADKLLFPLNGGPPYYANNSFSGNEANRLFLNDGVSFHDVSGISGTDHKGDGRGFATLDYDRDGWQDIVLYSTNYPRIKLYRNLIGERIKNRSRIEVRLEGGHRTTSPTETSSSRDGVGAKILATYKDGKTQIRRVSAGEGNVAQNSLAIWFGQQTDNPVIAVYVVWPSGREQVVTDPSVEKINLIVEPRSLR